MVNLESAKIRKMKSIFEKYDADVIAEGLQIIRERAKNAKSVNVERSTERSQALGSFEYFCKRYFASYFPVEDGPAQQELTEVVERFRGKHQRTPVKVLRAMPRGYGKSTRMSFCAPLWLLLRKEWHFVVMVSSTIDSAKRLLNAIISECEDNQLLLEDFPELRPARDQKGGLVSWSDYDIAFQGGARIIAKGFLNAVRGARHKQYRPSALVIDDPDEERDVVSESKMKRKYQWLDRAALKLGSQWGVDVLVAYTTIAPNCVGEHVYSSDKYTDWDRKKWKAIEVDEAGKEFSTWPQGAPIEALQAEREKDAITFAQERQNEPLAEADQKFKGLIRTYEFEPRADWAGWRLALACDLSLGKSEKSDYSAIVGVGLSPEGIFYQLYSDIQRRRPDAIERDLLEAAQLFPWTVIGVESNANQEYFLLNFRRIVADYNKSTTRKVLCPLKDISNTGDKEARVVAGLQPLVAAGMLLMRQDAGILLTQLEEFPYSYKDGPDALEMAVRLIKDHDQVVTIRTEAKPVAKNLAGKISQDRMRNIMKRYQR